MILVGSHANWVHLCVIKGLLPTVSTVMQQPFWVGSLFGSLLSSLLDSLFVPFDYFLGYSW